MQLSREPACSRGSGRRTVPAEERAVAPSTNPPSAGLRPRGLLVALAFCGAGCFVGDDPGLHRRCVWTAKPDQANFF